MQKKVNPGQRPGSTDEEMRHATCHELITLQPISALRTWRCAGAALTKSTPRWHVPFVAALGSASALSDLRVSSE